MAEATSQPPTLASKIGLWLGPAAAIVLWGLQAGGIYLDAEQPSLNAMAGAFAWIAIWWLTEAIPLAATSLLPLVLFPLLEIQPVKEVAASYGDHNIFLFLGGFLIALAIEQSGLHKRVALTIVYIMGDNPVRLLLGFMIATGLMSMWISNTATTLLMLPIAGSILAVADIKLSSDAARRELGDRIDAGYRLLGEHWRCGNVSGNSTEHRLSEFLPGRVSERTGRQLCRVDGHGPPLLRRLHVGGMGRLRLSVVSCQSR